MRCEEFLKQIEPSLGCGIYRLSEIARYTGVHPSTVRSWFKGRSDKTGGGPVFQSDFVCIEGTYSASFFDLVDVLIAAQFRKCGVRMRVIRAAHVHLQKELVCKHPFCHRDLYTDGRKIIILAANDVGDKTLSEVVSGQRLFLQIEKHLKRIEYSHPTRFAERWRVSDGVVIDPAVSRGKPCIAGTGITTFVIRNFYFANGQDPEFVADLYDLDKQDVINAVNFEQDPTRRAA